MFDDGASVLIFVCVCITAFAFTVIGIWYGIKSIARAFIENRENDKKIARLLHDYRMVVEERNDYKRQIDEAEAFIRRLQVSGEWKRNASEDDLRETIRMQAKTIKTLNKQIQIERLKKGESK